MSPLVAHRRLAPALRWLLLLSLALLGLTTAWGQASVTSQGVVFTSAQGASRTYMDVGGAWNGATDAATTTGDTFQITLRNTGNATAFDFVYQVVLPVGFQFVTGTQVMVPGSSGLVLGSPQVTVTGTPATGQTVQFNFSNSPNTSNDLVVGQNVVFRIGVIATNTVTNGTYQVQHRYRWATSQGGTLGAFTTTQQAILVREGDFVIVKTPSTSTAAVYENVTWTVTIFNSGFGGLFDVVLDESAISPFNPARTVNLISMTKISPVRADTTFGPGQRRLTYLAPGEFYTYQVVGQVTSCLNIQNVVSTSNRVDTTPVSTSASVQLDLRQPLLGITWPATTLDYGVAVPVAVTVESTGAGPATAVVLDTNLHTLPVMVDDVGTDWGYNPGNGDFTYTGGTIGGTIPNGSAVALTFTLTPVDVCAPSGGSIFYVARYSNPCGTGFQIPDGTAGVAAPSNAPTVTAAKAVSDNTLILGQPATWTVTASGSNTGFISGGNVVFVDTLPATWSASNIGAISASAGSFTYSFPTITWTVPVAALAANPTLTIPFTAPTDSCLVNNFYTNSVSRNAFNTTRGCTVPAATVATSTVLVESVPTTDITAAFAEDDTPAGGTGYETGRHLNYSGGATTRDAFEAEAVTLRADYTFDIPLALPISGWDATYQDDLANLVPSGNIAVVAGSLRAIVNGGAPITLPFTVTSTGLSVELDSLAATVSTLSILYDVTYRDAVLGGGATGSATHRNRLNVAPETPPSPGCPDPSVTSNQLHIVPLARANLGLGLSGMPSVLDICQEFPLTISLNRTTGLNAGRVRVTLQAGADYAILPAAATFGGGLVAGDWSDTTSGNDRIWVYQPGGNAAAELPSDGTITVTVRRRGASPLTPTAINALVEFDDEETRETGTRDFSNTANAAPSRIRRGTLSLLVSPDTFTVVGATATWIIYVSNTDTGVAYNTIVTNDIPVGLTPNAAATNALNDDILIGDTAVSGQLMTWNLGSIPPGETRPVRVVADIGAVPGCSLTDTNDVVVQWGCDTFTIQAESQTGPDFDFPAGQMQVLHDTTGSFARLCDSGTVTIVVRNTGKPAVQNVVLQEVFSASSGLSFAPNTVELWTDENPVWTPLGAGGNPTGLGTLASPFQWTSAQIPELAELDPVGDPTSAPQEVRVRFAILGSETLATSSPQLTASTTATIRCGNVVSSPGIPFNIPVEQPRLTAGKRGRNVTANPLATFSEIVYGGAGDIVEWEVEVTNVGNFEARNVRINVNLAGSGGTATITGPGFTGSVTVNDNVPLTTNSGYVIPPLTTHTYIVTETLGSTCVDFPSVATATWGCVSNLPGNRSNLPASDTDNQDSADLRMVPNFASAGLNQTITNLPGGNARVDVVFTNSGGTARNFVVSSTLSSAVVLDTTIAPTVTSTNSSITGVTLGGTGPAYTFTLNPTVGAILRQGESATLTYYLVQAGEDLLFNNAWPALANEEDTPGTNETALPTAGANLVARMDFQSTCGNAGFVTDTDSLNPATPDLDFNKAGSRMVNDTAGNQNYDFEIRNEGETGSIADNILFEIDELGDGWTINTVTVQTPGTGGTGGAGTLVAGSPYRRYTFTPEQIGTLAQNTSAIIRVSARPTNGTTGALTMNARVRGEIRGQGGALPVPRYYSVDRRGWRVLGTTMTKAVQETSEAVAGMSTGTNLQVGEDVIFRLTARIFGMDPNQSPADTVSSIILRDSLRNTGNGGQNHASLGYVGHTFATAPNHTVTVSSVAAPTPVPASSVTDADAWVNFSVADLTAAARFQADLTARALNTTEGQENNNVFRNNWGAQMVFRGVEFESDDSDDGFSNDPNDVRDGDAHAQADVTMRLPLPTVATTVRNRTVNPTGPFTEAVTAQAGDILEFRLSYNNSSGRQVPIFDNSLTTTLSADLNLQAANAGADTNNDGTVDVATTGITGGAGGTITFDHTNTPIGGANNNLAQLNPNQTRVFLFRAVVLPSVSPSQVITTTVNTSGDTLAGASGNQAGPVGANGTPTGAHVLTATDPATVNIEAIASTKEIVSTSVGGDTSAEVLVGEQVRFRLTAVIPASTTTNFVVNDSLPAGLSLLQTPIVTIGSGISPTTQPTITPGTLPANGAPLPIQWNFGTLTTGPGSAATRTITIEYLTQVRNVASNTNGATLQNSASYSFNGSPVNLASQTLTVREPDLVVTKAASAEIVDAGDVVTYTVSITNNGSATAYDLALVDTLPSGVTLVSGSTVGLSAPEVAGQVLTWGRTQSSPVDLDLAPAGTLNFTYQVTVDQTVEPGQPLNNSLVVDYSSLDGDPGPDLGVAMGAAGAVLGERTGLGGAPNTYVRTASDPLIVSNVLTVVKTASGFTIPEAPLTPDGLRVGDVITYTLVVTVPELTVDATTSDLQIVDTLPPGLALVDFDAIVPAPHGGTATPTEPFAYTAPLAGTTAPAAGATGTVTWRLGQLVNAGDNVTGNNTLTLVYRARVLDDSVNLPPTPSTADRANQARLQWRNHADVLQTSANSIATVAVRQPLLTLAKARLTPPVANAYATGDTVRYRLTIANTGLAPAYNTTLRDLIPDGLRAAPPSLTLATNGPTNVLATLSPLATWNSGTGEWALTLPDTQPLLPGASLILEYAVTVEADAPRAPTTLDNSATIDAYFSKPAADPTARRAYAVVGPATVPVLVYLSLSGQVWRDDEPNGLQASGEDWSAGTPVYVNLVRAGSVVQSILVTPGSGNWQMTGVEAGNYTLVVTTTAGSTAATAPSTWSFGFPGLFGGGPDGTRTLTLTNTDQTDLDFGLFQGVAISGRVFADIGTASPAHANNGVFNSPNELGINDVPVEVTDGSGTVLATTRTGGDGTYTLRIVGAVAPGTTLRVRETNLANYVSTGGQPGNSGGTYDRALDQITFTYVLGTNYVGLDFGDVPVNSLQNGQRQMVVPGGVARYRHLYRAGTGGEVTFSVPGVATPNHPGWVEALYLDLDADGQQDPGEPLATAAPLTVTPGQEVHLLLVVQAPLQAGLNEQYVNTLTASFEFLNEAAPPLTSVLTNEDVTTVGEPGSGGPQMTLRKSVNVVQARPGDTITYTLTFTNLGQGPITEVVVHDTTPAYTTFVSAAFGTTPTGLTNGVITAPAVGAEGALRWTFTGTLVPGAEGTVTYTVQINP